MSSDFSSHFSYHPTLFREYTIQAEDTLSSIAYGEYKDARWETIIEDINTDILSANQGQLMPGQKIRLPVPVPSEAARRISLYHTVAEGGPRTLSELAYYYYSTEFDYYSDTTRYVGLIAIKNWTKSQGYPGIDEILPIGSRLLIPNLLAADVASVPVTPSYQFNSVSVWARRWVNLLRSMKTTQAMAADQVDLAEGRLEIVQGNNAAPASEPPTTFDYPEPFTTVEPLEPADPDSSPFIVENRDEDVVDPTVEDDGRDWSEIQTTTSGSLDPNTTDFSETRITPAADGPPDIQDIYVEPEPAIGSIDTWREPAQSALFTTVHDELERLQLKVINNLLLNLGHFTDMEIGPCVASLTPPRWKPTYHNRTPPSSLLRAILNTAANDLEYIENALHQRQRLYDATGKGEITLQAYSLYQADRISASAIRPFQALLPCEPGKDINALTYYTDNMHIRQIPYDKSVVLIGLPFVSVSTEAVFKEYDELTFDQDAGYEPESKLPFDYMAIPHEVGHFVFHFGEVGEQKVVDHLRARLDADYPDQIWFRGWFEEIFADTVGLFVAGPLAVLGIQSILVDSFIEEFTEDDGHHPMSAIRPFLMTEILREMSKRQDPQHSYAFAPTELDHNWEAVLRMKNIVRGTEGLDQVQFVFNAHPNHLDALAAHHFSNRRARLALRAGGDRFNLLGSQSAIKNMTLPEILAAVRPMIKTCVNFVMDTAHPAPEWGPWSVDLSAHDSPLSEYDGMLNALLNLQYDYFPEEQAVSELRELTPKEIFIPAHEAEERVIRLMNQWGDSGPIGGGVTK